MTPLEAVVPCPPGLLSVPGSGLDETLVPKSITSSPVQFLVLFCGGDSLIDTHHLKQGEQISKKPSLTSSSLGKVFPLAHRPAHLH